MIICRGGTLEGAQASSVWRLKVIEVPGTEDKKRVLVVEDEALVAWLLRDQLLEAGYAVIGVAATEEAALDAFRRERPDIAIVDVNLRRGDGISAAREMTREGGDVLFLTAHGRDQVQASGVGTAVMHKPFRPGAVVDAVRAVGHMQGTGSLPDWAPPELELVHRKK
jgi:DNA-binding response OmpR family regulator